MCYSVYFIYSCGHTESTVFFCADGPDSSEALKYQNCADDIEEYIRGSTCQAAANDSIWQTYLNEACYSCENPSAAILSFCSHELIVPIKGMNPLGPTSASRLNSLAENTPPVRPNRSPTT